MNFRGIAIRAAFLQGVQVILVIQAKLEIIGVHVQASTGLKGKLLVVVGGGKNMDFRGIRVVITFLQGVNIVVRAKSERERVIRLVQASAGLERKFLVVVRRAKHVYLGGTDARGTLFQRVQVAVGCQQKIERTIRLVQASARLERESLVVISRRKDVYFRGTGTRVKLLYGVKIAIPT